VDDDQVHDGHHHQAIQSCDVQILQPITTMPTQPKMMNHVTIPVQTEQQTIQHVIPVHQDTIWSMVNVLEKQRIHNQKIQDPAIQYSDVWTLQPTTTTQMQPKTMEPVPMILKQKIRSHDVPIHSPTITMPMPQPITAPVNLTKLQQQRQIWKSLLYQSNYQPHQHNDDSLYKILDHKNRRHKKPLNKSKS